MAGVTYKCPSCGAYLKFNPDTQKWQCDFCSAEFDERELLAKADEYQQQADAEHARQTPKGDEGAQVVFHCPSCGSEIITDETTVATNCYYCHNPVVLQGKLTSDMKPELVLPFTVGKEKAVTQFMDWVKSKKFVPKGFFNEAQIKQMQGVYYPHFVTDCDVDATFDGEGRNVSVMDTPREIVTSTKHYAVHRRADISFHNIIRPALKSANRQLSDGIHPFPLDTMKSFSGAYLSGFLAERRDQTSDEATSDVEKELDGYLEPMLTESLQYNSHSGNAHGKITKKKSRYVLLPSWILTYKGANEKEPYYYAMNGVTGKVCGKLPVNAGKLNLVGLGIAAACFAVCCVLCYFLF